MGLTTHDERCRKMRRCVRCVKMCAAKEWQLAKGTLPKQSVDAHETTLARWLMRCKQRYAQGRLSSSAGLVAHFWSILDRCPWGLGEGRHVERFDLGISLT